MSTALEHGSVGPKQIVKASWYAVMRASAQSRNCVAAARAERENYDGSCAFALTAPLLTRFSCCVDWITTAHCSVICLVCVATVFLRVVALYCHVHVFYRCGGASQTRVQYCFLIRSSVGLHVVVVWW